MVDPQPYGFGARRPRRSELKEITRYGKETSEDTRNFEGGIW